VSADFDLLLEALGLKEVPRAGWARVGISPAESVADHTWGVALLALVLCPPELDRERVLAIAVLHDLAEVRTGDIVPGEMPREQKADAERQAIASLLKAHPTLWALWEDYEKSRTAEARFVHELDKLEMALQARRYAARADTREFLDSARRSITDPRLRSLLPEEE
jgi:putative hydrolase of HD superfamily